LHVYHATTNGVARFESGDATALVQFKDSGTTLVPPSIGAVSNALVMQTNNIEAARIDNSGNLLVGTTSPDDSTDGFKVKNGGEKLTVTRDGAEPLVLNRRTSDGDIVRFRKDNTTVGSIGVLKKLVRLGTMPATWAAAVLGGVTSISPAVFKTWEGLVEQCLFLALTLVPTHEVL
jgi:hypothetical protein